MRVLVHRTSIPEEKLLTSSICLLQIFLLWHRNVTFSFFVAVCDLAAVCHSGPFSIRPYKLSLTKTLHDCIKPEWIPPDGSWKNESVVKWWKLTQTHLLHSYVYSMCCYITEDHTRFWGTCKYLFSLRVFTSIHVCISSQYSACPTECLHCSSAASWPNTDLCKKQTILQWKMGAIKVFLSDQHI